MSKPRLKTAKVGEGIGGSLTIDSLKNQFKVAYSGEETFSLNSGNGYSWTKTITHNFGYKPQAMAWGYTIVPSGDDSTMVKQEKFALLPYQRLYGTTPLSASFVASIERSTTQVKFKFFQQTNFTSPAANNYTLTNMKMRYLVFIDAQ